MSHCFNIEKCFWSAKKFVDDKQLDFFTFQWIGGETYSYSSSLVRAVMTYDDQENSFSNIELSTTTQTVVLLEEYAGHSYHFDSPYEFEDDGKVEGGRISDEWLTAGGNSDGIFRIIKLGESQFTISGLARTLSDKIKTADATFDHDYRMVMAMEEEG